MASKKAPAKKRAQKASGTLDLDAAIVPGKSAAGVRLGQSIEEVLATNTPRTIEELVGMTSYTFASVKLWATGGGINQIGLVNGYRGKLGRIAVGSVLAELEKLGEVSMDNDDNTIVVGLLGVVFDVKRKAKTVAGIYVSSPDEQEVDED